MINDLLRFEQSLQTWGLEFEKLSGRQTNWHPKLQPMPKGVGVLAIIGADGLPKVELFPQSQSLRYYNKNKFEAALTFKHEVKKEMSKRVAGVRRHLACTITLHQHVDDGTPQFKALGVVSERLGKVDPAVFDDQLTAGIKVLGVKKACYVSLEVQGAGRYPVPIQSEDCLRKVNARLLEIEGELSKKSTSKDFFNNPIYGYKEKEFVVKTKYMIPVYSRNEENRCYERYGLNSYEACRMGSVTRGKINSILRTVMDRSREVRNDQSRGVWFEYSDKKRKDTTPQFRYIVLTSLSPNDNLLEGDPLAEDAQLSVEGWNQRVEKWVNMLTQQQEAIPDLRCMVVILQAPKNGAWNVAYSRSWNSDEIKRQVLGWHEGVRNGVTLEVPGGTFAPPNLRQWLRSMNRSWSMRRRKTKPDDRRMYEFKDDFEPLFSMRDAYEFLFDNHAVVDRVTAMYANRVVPLIIGCAGGTATTPFALKHLVPVGNIVLLKNGITKERIMETWAYWLGRLMREANGIHRAYFTSRDMKVPSDLVGHRFIKMAQFNPRRAMSLFEVSVANYIQWAEHYYEQHKSKKDGTVYVPLYQYRDAHNKLANLMMSIDGALPLRTSDTERILLGAGYNFRHPKKAEASTVTASDAERQVGDEVDPMTPTE